MLSLRHYLIFKTTAETGSFTAAAKKLYITQSAVSHAIHEIEAYTKMTVFDRTARQIRLTYSGSMLLKEILPILSACESLEKRMRTPEFQPPLQIVSSITIAAFWLPGILKKFKERRPEAAVHVKVVPAAEAIETLLRGDADAAFVEGARPQGPFSCRSFASYRLLILCSPDYPASPRLSADQFCSEKLLLRETGSAIRDTLDSRLYLLGRTAQPIWTSVNSTALIQAAEAGLGITVLPDVLVKRELRENRLRVLRVEDLNLENELLAVTRKNSRPAPPALDELLTLFYPG